MAKILAAVKFRSDTGGSIGTNLEKGVPRWDDLLEKSLVGEPEGTVRGKGRGSKGPAEVGTGKPTASSSVTARQETGEHHALRRGFGF